MIETFTDKWVEYTEVNNSSYEILTLGKENVLIFRDFLKYPDQLRSFIDTLKFNIATLNFYSAKPGKSYDLIPEMNNIHAKSLLRVITKTFGCEGIYCPCCNINCFNGDMGSHYSYPHVDASLRPNELGQPQYNITIAGNIGLTKNLKGGTGFWSYHGMMNAFDMSQSQLEHYRNYSYEKRRLSDAVVDEVIQNIDSKNNYNFPTKWHQIEDEDGWKLEYICPLEYNTLVLYSSLVFHNPYIKPEWYLTEDRVSIASFFDVDPRTLSYDDTNKSSISKVWKSFRLDKIHNVNFD